MRHIAVATRFMTRHAFEFIVREPHLSSHRSVDMRLIKGFATHRHVSSVSANLGGTAQCWGVSSVELLDVEAASRGPRALLVVLPLHLQ